MQQTGVRSGILLAVLGVWVLLRTVNHDQSGRTLIDHILGKTTSVATPAPTPGTPRAAAPTTGRPGGQVNRNPNPATTVTTGTPNWLSRALAADQSRLQQALRNASAYTNRNSSLSGFPALPGSNPGNVRLP